MLRTFISMSDGSRAQEDHPIRDSLVPRKNRNATTRTAARLGEISRLLLPEGRAGRGTQAGEETQEDFTQLTSDLRRVHAGNGGHTPLDGFMRHADWRGSCLDMKLTGGVFWPIPITLPVNQDLAGSIHAEEEVALVDAETGDMLAVMQVHEKYSIDKQLEAELSIAPPIRSIQAWRRCWRREMSICPGASKC